MVNKIVLMRHAEREDRALEAEGFDWILNALRPQDPLLSNSGIRQAANAGRLMESFGITRILSSPMIRTVITSDIVATQLVLGENSICVEMGLVEEAKSFRGKTSSEPRPNWNPLILPPSILKLNYSSRINEDYVTATEVHHVRDEEKSNTVKELHDTITDRDEITRDRCRKTVRNLINSEFLKSDDVILCVGHGATVSAMTKALEAGLPAELTIKGDRPVSCFALFEPLDPSNPFGPWKASTTHWQSGNVENEVENAPIEDMGFAAGCNVTEN